MGKRRHEERDFFFDHVFFYRLGTIARLLYPGFEWAVFYTIGNLLITIGIEVVTYFIGQVPSQMYVALGQKKESTFRHIFLVGSFEYIGKCLLIAMGSFFSWMLYLVWRKNAIRKLSDRYFSHRNYYNINCIDDHGIDNPDQRITQDVDRMCNKLATDILPSILIGPFVIAWYTYKTATTAGGIGVGIVYGYFVIGTIVNRILLSPMVKWNARVEKAEGDFRYKHVTLRNNAEASALYGAEAFERHECDRVFDLLWWRQFWFMCWKLPNRFWQSFFDYYGALLSYAIMYVPIFVFHYYDHTDPSELAGIISKNAFIYIYLINSFTRITDTALTVGEIAGIMQRVSEFMRVCEENQRKEQIANELPEKDTENDDGYDNYGATGSTTDLSANESDRQKKEEEDIDVVYTIDDLSYSQPDDPDKRMLDGLTMRIRSTSNIVITGPSGCGKSSLLRVIAGLWKRNAGSITNGKLSGFVMHMPQSPYFPSGHLTLRQQIAFPRILAPLNDAMAAENEQIESILSALDLSELVDRCYGLDNRAEFEWQETLTPGEQQRLSFARLLYHRPVLAILDESTSSVSVDMEEKMYKLLQLNGIHYVSVGHRPTLIDFHDIELRLSGKYTYEIQLIRKSF